MTLYSPRRGVSLAPLPTSGQPLPQSNRWRGGVQDGLWIFGIWLISRIFIAVLLQGLAPRMPWATEGFWDPMLGWQNNFVPHPSWELFTHWDGAWYQRIIQMGYDYEAGVDRRAAVVFFPAFPLLCWFLMRLGLSYAMAGVMISNAAFLGTMVLLYRWVRENHSRNVARWSLIALGFMPCALYSIMAYTESLFLLSTLGALYYFRQRRYRLATFWGIIATATRPPGLLLVPALLWVSWRQKRSSVAYISALLMSFGCGLFTLYCAWRFGHPFAWVTSHRAWADGVVSWELLVARLFYPQLGSWIRLGIFMACFGLLAYYHRHMEPELQAHTTITLFMLLASNSTEGLMRYLYVLPELAIALGLFLSRHRLLRFPVLGLSLGFLTLFTLHFAWYHWVA
jgi:Gpi18-like mannosyltransferase